MSMVSQDEKEHFAGTLIARHMIIDHDEGIHAVKIHS